jgi:RNase adaptor protein for sRNA GlmZ degradation
MKRWQQYDLARVVVMTACAMVSLTCSGCFALAVGAAGGAAGAVYVLGKLTDELNHEVPVVHAAATQAMNDLELKLSEDRSDKLTAHMKSEFADGTNVWIDMQSIAEGRTKLTIRVGVTGDEMRARKIHEAIKRHLPREVS